MIKKGALTYAIITAILLYILYYFKDSDHLIGILAFVFSLLFFYIGDKALNLEFKVYHYFIILFMAGSGLLLSPLYVIYPSYDKLLHFINPFLGCFLIFYVVDKFEISKDIKIKLFLTFTIMMTLITFTEIVEFALDWFFDLKLQGVFRGNLEGLLKQIEEGKFTMIQDPNTDTMIDIILGTIGSILFILTKKVPYFNKSLNH